MDCDQRENMSEYLARANRLYSGDPNPAAVSELTRGGDRTNSRVKAGGAGALQRSGEMRTVCDRLAGHPRGPAAN